jgi:hypothetical protein
VIRSNWTGSRLEARVLVNNLGRDRFFTPVKLAPVAPALNACRLVPAGVISASRDHGATGGTIPTAKGIFPTGTVATTKLVAVRITETLADFRFAT